MAARLLQGRLQVTLEQAMQDLGWEFFQTGPQEGQWLLAEGDNFIAWQGDERWRADLNRAHKRAYDANN